MKVMHGTPLPSMVQVTDEVAGEVAGERRLSVIRLDKKLSVLDLSPNDRDSRAVTESFDDNDEHKYMARNCDHDVCSGEQQSPLVNEVCDVSNIFAPFFIFY